MDIISPLIKSPEITKINWGSIHIEIKNKVLIFKDVKLFPGGGIEWDWKITGTKHDPGIQIMDLKDLVEAGAEKIILGKGFYGRLKVQEDTIDYMKKLNLDYYILNTEDAIRQYNRLRVKYAVGALIHTTR